MNCQEVMELMQRHVDKDLNEQEASLMMDHVGQCPDCAAMLDKLVRLSRGLEQMPRVKPPYSLVDAIMPRLAQQDAAMPAEDETSHAATSRRAHRSRRSWLARISGVVALGVVVALVAVNGPFSGGGRQQDASKSANFANSGDANTLQSASGFTSKELKAKDQYGKPEAPSADARKQMSESAQNQAPAEAPFSGNATSMESGASDRGLAFESSDALDLKGTADSLPGSAAGSADTHADPPLSMMGSGFAAEEAVSPDGLWKAVLTSGTLQLYHIGEDRLAYERTPDSGIRSNLVWRADSSALDYSYTDAEGKTTARSLLVPDMKEIERP